MFKDILEENEVFFLVDIFGGMLYNVVVFLIVED